MIMGAPGTGTSVMKITGTGEAAMPIDTTTNKDGQPAILNRRLYVPGIF